jgi:putative ABC transport system permease protein
VRFSGLRQLGLRSMLNRRLVSLATVISVAVSLLLLFSVERVRRSLENSFTQTVSGVDLIAGARSGSLQLVLYSVFNIGQATNNVSFETYKKIEKMDAVDWSIPYSLGDGHRGFRVVATNTDFFAHYQVRNHQNLQFASGGRFSHFLDIVIGAEVAKTLKYKIGDELVLAHGSTTGDSFAEHTNKPFKVVGILDDTGTAIDRSLYISLEGMEAIHVDWQTGAAPRSGQEIKTESITADMLKPKTITSFFIKAKSKIAVLQLQRDINEYMDEPLLAVIPGVVLAEFWQTLSQVELIFKIISALVMIVGLIGMMISILTSINERRREMAILRSLGASLNDMMSLIVFEVLVILTAAVALACGIKFLFELLFLRFIEKQTGLIFSGPIFGWNEVLMMALTFVVGVFFSIYPAWQAKNKALKDGLTVKV